MNLADRCKRMIYQWGVGSAVQMGFHCRFSLPLHDIQPILLLRVTDPRKVIVGQHQASHHRKNEMDCESWDGK